MWPRIQNIIIIIIIIKIFVLIMLEVEVCTRIKLIRINFNTSKMCPNQIYKGKVIYTMNTRNREWTYIISITGMRRKNPFNVDNLTVVKMNLINFSYYRTTDTAPLLMTELLAEKTEIYTARFWAQLFGTVHIGFAFFTSFILQLLRYVAI